MKLLTNIFNHWLKICLCLVITLNNLAYEIDPDTLNLSNLSKDSIDDDNDDKENYSQKPKRIL